MDSAEKQARDIKRLMERACAPRHEYRQVDARSFRHLDLGFYDRTRDALVAKGASWLGDIENLTLKGEMGDMRTFIRSLVSGDHTVSIGIYHPKPKFFVRLVAWILRIKITRSIDCETELQNGGYMVTTNTAMGGAFEPPPGFDVMYLPAETGVDSVYEIHRQRMRDHLASNPGAGFTAMRTMEDVLEMQHRMSEAKAAFRKSVGLITEAELKKMGTNPRRAAKIKAELERMESAA